GLCGKQCSRITHVDTVDDRYLAVVAGRRGRLAVRGEDGRVLETENKDAAHIGPLVVDPADPAQRLRQGETRALERNLLVTSSRAKHGKAVGLEQRRDDIARLEADIL